MKLTLEQLRQAAWGAVEVTQTPGGIRFYRFTAKQRAMYLERAERFGFRSLATAGIKLVLRTDSPWLRLRVRTEPGVLTRSYYAFVVEADGRTVGRLQNFSAPILEPEAVTAEYPLGPAEGDFPLGVGEKTVSIHFPWTVQVRLEAVELADGAMIQPIRPEKRMLMFGDSITQGWDAMDPRSRYAARLAGFLGMEEINKAIGGEMFFPELALTRDPLTPDLISVAYGSNDFAHQGNETLFRQNCRAFYHNLRQTYPTTPILALAPIWRKDQEGGFGAFHRVADGIRAAVEDLEQVHVIDCYSFVPQDLYYFSDGRTHPNERGFGVYSARLLEAVREIWRREP